MQTLIATPRKDLKKSVLRSLRNSGKIPGVVYGKTTKNTPIHVDEKEFFQVVKEHGTNAVIKLMWGEDQSTVMLGEVQQDPLKNLVYHVDFNEVNMDKPINAEVPIDWQGESEGEKQGGVLQKQYHAIEISCVPGDIPEYIHLDISKLEIGDSLTVGDLQLGKNIEVQLPEDAVLISVSAPDLDPVEEEPQQDDDPEPKLVENDDSEEESK